ncbi:MAG TPA: uroporphyrinogen decarboxylase family protein [Planctomycetota bacterium]|nr:uroporphyrinogen decarboxylase family protein [Planctomycetota bacterium]
MTSRERVLAALRCEEPDRVPYCELWIDPRIARRMVGWPDGVGDDGWTADEAKSLAARLGMDNILYVLRPPIYAQTGEGEGGRQFLGHGMIQTEADLRLIELPDPCDEALWAQARAFAQGKGDYAAFFVTRLGLFPTIMSMGFEAFSIALYENRPLVEAVLDRYTDWAAALAERAAAAGFDAFVTTDDMAFKSGPFFSPAVFRELVVPRFRRVAERLTIPWVFHSDGNMAPVADDLVALGVAGLHPNEKGAMDIRAMKRRYAGRLCLLGNVEMDLLGRGTPRQVAIEVRALIRDVAPGGGYIASSGNSLASFLKPENILAMSRAAHKHGRYPIPHRGATRD